MATKPVSEGAPQTTLPADTTSTQTGQTQTVLDLTDPIYRAEFYRDRYHYTGPPISGTIDYLSALTRMRPVLDGVLYRGGVRSKEGDDDHPLNAEALISLCEEGFGTAVYLPRENFYDDLGPLSDDKRFSFDEQTGDIYAKCYSRLDGQENTLRYTHKHASKKEFKNFTTLVYEAMLPGGKPIYAHCLGGLHRAGLMASISLVQFCGLNNTPHTDRFGKIQHDAYGGELSDASLYWYNNAGTLWYETRDPLRPEYDPNDDWFNDLMSKINDFTIFPEYTITDSLRDAVCPANDPVDPTNGDYFDD